MKKPQKKTNYNFLKLKDFRLDSETYIRRLDKGESFTVIKRSKPIFKMVPIDDDEDGMWESIADFTKINPNGIPVMDFIKALRKLNG